MLNKAVARTLLCLAALTVTCGTLLAASQDDSARQTAVVAGPSINHRADLSSPKLKTIYSNLGPKGNRYDCSNGWLVMGSANTYFSYSQWIAMPFTPTANHKVTEIQIAFTEYASGSGFTLSLNADSSGLPGNALHTWEIKHLKGSCPDTLDAVTYKRGIKVSKGKQYWVVAQTDSTNADTVEVWNYVYNEATGSFAYDIGDAGWTAYNSNLSAFALYGH